MKSTFILSISCATIIGLGGMVASTGAAQQTRDRASVNLLVRGDSDGAIRQARIYLDALRAHQWDFRQVNDSVRTVPDQQYAQLAMERRRPTFAVPYMDPKVEHLYRGQVAIDSDLYVRRTVKVVPGIEGITEFEGFFIVGWFDGRVEKVPVDKVRMIKIGDGYSNVYPGMKEYRNDLPLFVAPPGTYNEMLRKGMRLDDITKKGNSIQPKR